MLLLRTISLAVALSVALISGALAAEDAEPASTGGAEPGPADAGGAEPSAAGAPLAAEPAAAEPSGAEPEPAAAEPIITEPERAPETAPEVKNGEVPVSLFEYIEDLLISGPEGAAGVHLRSSTLVAVFTEPGRITVEIRPRPNRARSKPGDPAPGKISLLTDAGGNTSWDIKPQSAVFDFRPGPRGSVLVEGPGKEAVNEAITVLSQGPTETTPKMNSETGYRIEVRSNKRTLMLEGRQETKDLWVDWKLSGSGTFEVGGRGWEMDMNFRLPEGSVDVKKGKARLGALATMRYSSDRAGPEAETTLNTTLTLTDKKGDYTYVRSCELRPMGPSREVPPRKKPSGPTTKKALAGGASAWARTATLATLGVQRLAGVRETGLAMWLAQASIDSAAGRVIPRAADRPQRRTLKTVAKLSPFLEAPEGLLRDDLFSEKWLIRFETGQSLIDMNSMITVLPSGKLQVSRNTIVVPSISLSVRRKIKNRWRLGGGLEGMLVRIDTGDPRISWSWLNLSGRAEYMAETWNIALSLGSSFVQYDMDSSSRTASANLRTIVYGLDLEKLLRKRWGLGINLRFAGDPEGFLMAFAQPSARWYFTKNASLQVHVMASWFDDRQAIGGYIDSWGVGGGVGVTMRW